MNEDIQYASTNRVENEVLFRPYQRDEVIFIKEKSVYYMSNDLKWKYQGDTIIDIHSNNFLTPSKFISIHVK